MQIGVKMGGHAGAMAILGLLLGLAGTFVWSSFKRKRAKTCPSCYSETLIPVGSPEGLRIMKELGYVEG